MDERQAHPEWEEKEYKPKSEAACVRDPVGSLGSSRVVLWQKRHPDQVLCPPGTMWACDHSCAALSQATSGPPSCSQVDGEGGSFDTGTVEILKIQSALFFFFFLNSKSEHSLKKMGEVNKKSFPAVGSVQLIMRWAGGMVFALLPPGSTYLRRYLFILSTRFNRVPAQLLPEALTLKGIYLGSFITGSRGSGGSLPS